MVLLIGASVKSNSTKQDPVSFARRVFSFQLQLHCWFQTEHFEDGCGHNTVLRGQQVPVGAAQ